MHILISENHTGNEIVKALSSISGYKTKVLTKTEVFDEKLGIVPGKVKIQLTSLLPDFYVSPNANYFIFITIKNIVLTCKYYVIDMQINYIRNTNIVNVELVNNNNKNKTALAIEIEAVIRQFLKNLSEPDYALEV
jgi:hypothetical protein